MIILHIAHTVVHFDNWKESFDNHEEFRKQAGVRRYRVSRGIDNPNYVMIDLEFDRLSEAQALLAGVQQVWGRVSGTLILNPEWRFSEVVQIQQFQNPGHPS
jgi:hypothetical protein